MKMLSTLTLALAAAAVVVSPGAHAAEVYDIDSAHTTIAFKISHLGFSNTHGAFPGVTGIITIDDEKLENSSVEVTVDAASVNTNNQGRDDHLRNEDFFNVSQHKEITFKSTKWKKAKDGYEVTGDLTLLGNTKPVTLHVKQLGAGEGMKGEYRRGFETTFKINRSDFGMDKMVGPIGDEVELTVSLEAVRRDEAKS